MVGSSIGLRACFLAEVWRSLFLDANAVADGFTCGAAKDGIPRVVSNADFHGDWKHATEHLAALGISRDDSWTGGSATFVYTGDIVDRGDNGKALWELMFKLQDQAPESGGRVILLLGNHELMNLQKDLRYVSKNDFAAYGGKAEHTKAWAPDGAMGTQLRQRIKGAAIVADVVYVHAGLLPSILSEVAPSASGEEAIRLLNERVADVLKGDAVSIRSSQSQLLHDGGPFWTRTLALGAESIACPLLEKALKVLQVRRMVVGHTPQQDGSIALRCGGRLVLGDTFMSEAYTGSAKASVHNEAAFEFYGDSSSASAVYPQRQDGSCIPLPLAPEFAVEPAKMHLRGSSKASVNDSFQLPVTKSVDTVQKVSTTDEKRDASSGFGPSPTMLVVLIGVALAFWLAGRKVLNSFKKSTLD